MERQRSTSRGGFGGDGQVQVWDPSTGRLLTTMDYPEQVVAVAWSPDGIHLAFGSSDGVLRVLDSRRPARSAYLHLGPIFWLDFSSAGIAVGGPEGVAVLNLALTDDPSEE